MWVVYVYDENGKFEMFYGSWEKVSLIASVLLLSYLFTHAVFINEQGEEIERERRKEVYDWVTLNYIDDCW